MVPRGDNDRLTRELREVGRGPYTTLVLAEWDDDLWLTTVRFEQPPQPGMTFHFLDTVWQITWTQAVGCGAVPLEM